jgi:D-alanine-D-alanine ligase
VSEQRKIRVAVVFGGRGPEHAVSVMGGGNMLSSIDRSKYEVIPIGITREGNWVQVADEPGRLAITGGELPSVEAAAIPGSQVVPWSGGVMETAPAQIPQLFGDVDVVLPVLHGPYGEDGTIQGLLEMAGVRYVGAGVLASAVSMDKEYMNLIFKARGLPIGPYVVVHERDWPAAGAAADQGDTQAAVERKRVMDEIAELGWPLFVKPARGGSSIGTSKANDIAELHEAIARAREYDPKVLVEAAIDGVEVEVSVLEGVDGAPPDTSLPGQLLVDGGEDFWDFEAKYLDPASGMAIPAPIPDSAIAEIRRLAAAAFEAVSCEGLARVDFFYTSDGRVLINEINTMPGLSPASYWQKMWEATGMTFPQLIDRLLQGALKKPRGLR